ncbi:MAG: hypothetical protein ABFR90_00120 [Planctomycetota bacterium]
MTFLSLIGLAVAVLALLGIILIIIFTKGPSIDETKLLNSGFKSNDEQKIFSEMSFDEIAEFCKEQDRIENDHSLEKKYIRFCLDELAQYPSEYILTLKESTPLPDYSEKGMEEIPGFKDLCAKIKDLTKLDNCNYIDPKICKLPFHVNNLDGGCECFSEICDGSDEPYVSFWLKRYVT